jgi:SAM-dependent methyltransferase
VDRLDENSCPPSEIYETEEYRRKLAEELDTRGYFKVSDPLQIFTQEILQDYPVRDKVVADIGCAGGSFLDQVSGLASRLIAIEPGRIYHASLKERGYLVFPYAAQADGAMRGQVDMAVSIQVIEHVLNPREFLEDIRPLLKPDGLLLVSTPNRRDILNSLLPDDYPQFFYRVVHRWYFDEESLIRCAGLAGFEPVRTHYKHRYTLSNALRWLRDRKPTGNKPLEGVTALADAQWTAYLEMEKRSDCLYAAFRPTGK